MLQDSQLYPKKLALAAMVVTWLLLTLILAGILVMTTSVSFPLVNVCVIQYLLMKLSVLREFGEVYRYNCEKSAVAFR